MTIEPGIQEVLCISGTLRPSHELQPTGDVQVSEFGSVDVEALMQIERYSHVMHISSTVTGRLKAGLDAWDALRAALPAGTVSGAPKVYPASCCVANIPGGCHTPPH